MYNIYIHLTRFLFLHFIGVALFLAYERLSNWAGNINKGTFTHNALYHETIVLFVVVAKQQ